TAWRAAGSGRRRWSAPLDFCPAVIRDGSQLRNGAAKRMRVRAWYLVAALMLAPATLAADFGSRDGPEPANIDEISGVLRQDPYDLELLISFGTSKGGSAGHIALAIREDGSRDDMVYSANFYADRSPEHAKRFYTDDLMIAVPKEEYLFKT